MIKKFAAGLLTFFYFSTLLAGDLKNIEISGFKSIETTQSMMKLKFRDQKPFIISKIKFSSEEQAKSFCKGNGLNLDTNGFDKTLLLAMSGAAILDVEIMKAIEFKLNDENSGIAAWTGSNNQIRIMWNGRGTDTETVSIGDVTRAAQKLGKSDAVKFSAVCE